MRESVEDLNVDTSALEEKLQAKMDELEGTEPAEEIEEIAEPTPKEKPAEEAKPDVDSTPEDEPEDEEVKDDDAEAKEADAQKEEDEVPELSDAYYRAAIHNGLEADEIKELMQQNPQLAIKTFAKMHDTLNEATKEFAAIGRMKAQQKLDEAEAKKTPAAKVDGIDLSKLKEEDPENPMIPVLEQVIAQNEALQVKYEEAQSNVQQGGYDDPKLASVMQQIDSFFRDQDMTDYTSVYGVVPKEAQDWDNLIPSEKMNRVAVIDMAEQLIEGAKAVGKEIEVVDALNRAHLLVTQPVREKVIRKDIMDSLVKRSKNITLKPSGVSSGTELPAKVVGSKELAETNAAARLAKVFGNG